MLLIGFAFFGAVLGSFIGVVAERVHTGQSFVQGRSRCNSCNRILHIPDLIPVFSWLLSRGACRACGSRIPAGYLALELMLGILFALSYLALGLSFPLLVFLGALSVLAFIVVYDLRHTIVPSYASNALMFLAVVYALIVAPFMGGFLSSLITAGIIAFGFFALFFLSKGRAMGLGDTPVAFSLALLVAPHAVSGLLFSFWIGALYGIAILVLRRGGPTMGIEVPFVPFMAAGFLLAYFTKWNLFLF
ncbi:prepilin peptidase [Candidatus Parcubacteria bacterium]|nr:prepilin peptidase [Candidatus Parcubacteria bacterium]